jgi:hypothetical protein
MDRQRIGYALSEESIRDAARRLEEYPGRQRR